LRIQYDCRGLIYSRQSHARIRQRFTNIMLLLK
jgi:hypothetical protein